MSKIVIIKEADEENFDEIWRIFQDVIEAGETYANDASTTKEEAYQKWFAKNAKTFVAKIDDKIVGAYLIKPNHVGRASHIANCSFIVDKNSRGNGVGKKIGAHAIEFAKNAGYKAIQYNFVVSTNKVAIALWQSLGFEIIGTIPQAFNHKNLGLVDAYIMFLAIS